MLKKFSGLILVLSLLLSNSLVAQEAAAASTIKVPIKYTNNNGDIYFYESKQLDAVNTQLSFLWSLMAITTGIIILEIKKTPRKNKNQIILPIKNVDYKLINQL